MIPEFCRIVLQTGLGIWIQSFLLITVGLIAGRSLHRLGPLAQAYVYKTTLLCLALSVTLSLLWGSQIKPLYRVALPERAVRASGFVDKTDIAASPVGTQNVIVATAPAIRNTGSPTVPVGLATAIARAVGGPPPEPAVSNSAMREIPRSHSSASPPALFGVPVVALAYTILAGIWLIGTCWHLGLLAISQLTLWRLCRRSSPIVDGPIVDLATRLSAKNRRRAQSLRCSAAIKTPFLMGVLHPVIMLPQASVENPESRELEAILTHELTHLAHEDCAANVCFRIASALLWPQPLLHMLFRRWAEAAEAVCDRAVVEGNCGSVAYAEYLLKLAENWKPTREPDRLLGMGMATFHSSLGKRVQHILELTSGHLPQLTGRMRAAIIFGAILAAAFAVRTISVAAVPHPISHRHTVRTAFPWNRPPDSRPEQHAANTPALSPQKGKPEMIKKSTLIASALLALAAGPVQVQLPAASAQSADVVKQQAAEKAKADASADAAKSGTLSDVLAQQAAKKASGDAATSGTLSDTLTQQAAAKASADSGKSEASATITEGPKTAAMLAFLADQERQLQVRIAEYKNAKGDPKSIKILTAEAENLRQRALRLGGKLLGPDTSSDTRSAESLLALADLAEQRASNGNLDVDSVNALHMASENLRKIAANTPSNSTGGINIGINHVNVANASVREVLARFFSLNGLNYIVDPDVSGKVTASISDVSVEVALRTILVANPTPLTYDIIDGVYHVKQKTSGPAATTIGVDSHADSGARDYSAPRIEVDALSKRCLINVRDVPVRDVLSKLFAGTNFNSIIDQDVTGNITMNLTDVQFDVALRAILRASSPPLTYDIENGIYHIKVKLVVISDESLPKDTVTLSLHDAPLSEALDQLFKQGHASYVLAPGHYETVTLNLASSGFGPALRSILAVASQQLTYDLEDGIVRIKPKVPNISHILDTHVRPYLK